jgi:hypothetical protein
MFSSLFFSSNLPASMQYVLFFRAFLDKSESQLHIRGGSLLLRVW